MSTEDEVELCECGKPLDSFACKIRHLHMDTSWAKEDRARAAAVLRVEIESALGDAWDEGWERCADLVQDGGTFKDYYDNPYRPTLAANEGDRQ